MSRVDDDRDAARVEQRLAEAKRAEQQKNVQRKTAEVGFSKLVAKSQTDTVKRTAQTVQHENNAKSAIAQLLHDAEEHLESARTLEGQHQQETGQKAKSTTDQQRAASHEGARAQGQSTERAKATVAKDGTAAQQNRTADVSAGALSADGRKSDAKVARDMLAERGASSESNSEGSTENAAAGAKGEKGGVKTDADKSGGGQQGGHKDGKDAPPTMRFNPALMAPIAVAKPKEATGSDRLRKVANELAQKIVERVRIGTNAAGKVEFQIDLRSDVLSGLQVKVSSQNGKIKATFTGTNKEVLTLIEAQGEALKAALAARGLTLEDFKVERRP
jgi:hypothetical protein